MSPFTSGLIGAAVATVAFGAAQLAMGNDIAGSPKGDILQTSGPASSVNRSSKSDRMPINSADALATKTVAVRLAEFPDTSVLIRIPAVVSRQDAIKPKDIAIKSAATGTSVSIHRQVACEPVVSVLTEVAKLLQPGRCVT